MLRPKKPQKTGANVRSPQASINPSGALPSAVADDSTDSSPPAYIKLSRKGSVVPVYRETYFRSEISCGVTGCKSCGNIECGLSCLPVLIPDTNVFIQEYDFITHPSLGSVIVLQTVLEEMQNLNMALYEKLRALIRGEPSRFYVFTNENSSQTFVERLPHETSNDRNDRAIRKVAEWYVQHLNIAFEFAEDQVPAANKRLFASAKNLHKVILLTNDGLNRKYAQEQGIHVASVRSFVSSLESNISKELSNLLSVPDNIIPPFGNPFTSMFEEYVSPNALAQGLENGRYLKGMITISPYNIREGMVVVAIKNGPSISVRIPGIQNLNRALNGDVVAIELLAMDYKCNDSEVITIDEDDPLAHVEDARTTANIEKKTQKTYDDNRRCARVVAIISRPERRVCGSFLPLKDEVVDNKGWTIFRPVDSRHPCVFVFSSHEPSSLFPVRAQVTIDSWPVTSRLPRGHIVSIIGPCGTIETETRVILIENDVIFDAFSERILNTMPSPDVICDDLSSNREDLRSLPCICSIDPPGCTDIDDALHARILGENHIEVGIHIADVGHWVSQGSSTDIEAARRGTTVYLTDRRIDMLPEVLGSNLCSLKSGVDRYALSCIVEMDLNATIKGVRFAKTLIQSSASLTYLQAQAIIDSLESSEDKDSSDPLLSNREIRNSIKLLNILAKKLRSRRVEAGALTLASSEIRFEFEDNSSERIDPIGIASKTLFDSNELVEEFMLLANIEAAKFIYEAFPDQAILRRHPSPPENNFSWLLAALKACDLPLLDISSSKRLSETLDVVDSAMSERQHSPSSASSSVARLMTTRAMMQAVYFASGDVSSPSEFWHYGLAVPIYTHFTSPIRRYSDIIVHRLISMALGLQTDSNLKALSRKDLGTLTAHLNHRHRRAQLASRSSIDLFVAQFLKRPGEAERILEANVVRVASNGLIVLVQAFGIELFLRFFASTSSHDAIFDAEQMAWINVYSKKPIVQIFDTIRVRLRLYQSAVPSLSKITVEWVDPPSEISLFVSNNTKKIRL